MAPPPAARQIADDLHHDVRDAFLPRTPPPGFRSFGCAGEAADPLRWRGLGGLAATARMLAALALRMAAAPRGAAPDADATALMRFAARDLLCDPDDPDYPPTQTPWTAPRRNRLMLATLYGDGPARDPRRYGAGGRLRRDPACAIADAFAALHNTALARLGGRDAAARFAAARRVTQATYRAILFGDALPALLRADVLAACDGALDHPAAQHDEAPVELTHAALALLCAPDATGCDLRRTLLRGVEGGVMRVDALAATLRPRLLAARRDTRGDTGGGADWLALDPAARARALAAFCARPPACEIAPPPTPDPPLGFFLWLERAAPAAQGGGDGVRLGALGSALAGESLCAIRRAGAAAVEDAPSLAQERAACFPLGPAPAELGALLRAVAEPGAAPRRRS